MPNVKDIVNLTSEFTDVSVRSEIVHKGHLSTPGKTRKRLKPVTEVQCDEFERCAVRRKVHYCFE